MTSAPWTPIKHLNYQSFIDNMSEFEKKCTQLRQALIMAHFDDEIVYCKACGRGMIPRRFWIRIPLEVRRGLPNFARKESEFLCTTDYNKAVRNGTLEQYLKPPLSDEEVNRLRRLVGVQ